MKYFTKYIPVDEEINEGDFVLTVPSNEVRQIKDFLLSDFKVAYSRNSKDYKKVKLFLCSRDIKVGDELTYIGSDGSVVESKLKYIDHVGVVHYLGDPDGVKYDHTEWEMENGYWWNDRMAYKVLGEVSPNAIWVKEWMEFDEKDWRGPIINREHFRARYFIHFRNPETNSFD